MELLRICEIYARLRKMTNGKINRQGCKKLDCKLEDNEIVFEVVNQNRENQKEDRERQDNGKTYQLVVDRKLPVPYANVF